MQKSGNVRETLGPVKGLWVALDRPVTTPSGTEHRITAAIPKGDYRTVARLVAAAEKACSYYWGCEDIDPRSLLRDGDGVRGDGTPYPAECRGYYLLHTSRQCRTVYIDMFASPMVARGAILPLRPIAYPRGGFRVFDKDLQLATDLSGWGSGDLYKLGITIVAEVKPGGRRLSALLDSVVLYEQASPRPEVSFFNKENIDAQS